MIKLATLLLNVSFCENIQVIENQNSTLQGGEKVPGLIFPNNLNSYKNIIEILISLYCTVELQFSSL